jgi:acetyl esterase/lipase
MTANNLLATITLLAMAALPKTLTRQPADSKFTKDIVYSTVGGQQLRLDLMQPALGTKPAPLIIWLHGGGWRQGNRQDYHAAMRDFARLGYAGASMEYRLAPAYKFPAPLDDARLALAFLRTNAAKYNLDPERIAVAGASAGGHLSLMLGLAKQNGDKSSNGIRAVIDISGPTDFRIWKIDKAADDLLLKSVGVNLDGLIADFLGTSDRQDRRMAEVSPITYVRKSNPAVLIIHGTGDSWVPFQQAQVLYDALKEAGATVKLVPFEGASHFADFWTTEQRAESRKEMEQFLEQNLKQR